LDETGHDWGAGHCNRSCSGIDPACGIMRSGIGPDVYALLSPASVAAIDAYKAGSPCLSTGTPSLAGTALTEVSAVESRYVTS